MVEINKATQKAIIEQELVGLKNTEYLLGVRARVGKKADNRDYEQAALSDLERVTRMIDALEEELASVEKAEG